MTQMTSRDLQRKFESIGRGDATEVVLGRFGNLGVQYAKGYAHRFKKTGHLEQTIRVLDVDARAQSVTIGAGGTKLVALSGGGTGQAGYAAFVEYGTRPHRIVPKRKKALAFPSQKLTTQRFGAGARLSFRKTGNLTNRSVARFGNAAFVVTKSVRHPGTKPQPYLVPGAREALDQVGIASTIIDVFRKA